MTADTRARYVDSTTHVSVRLSFDPARPFEVLAALSNVWHAVTWTWSRDVLADSLRGPAGMGDVHMWPDGDEIRVRLQGLDDDDEFFVEVLALPRRDVERFVRGTTRAVPRGREPEHDWDGDLAQLIGGGR